MKMGGSIYSLVVHRISKKHASLSLNIEFILVRVMATNIGYALEYPNGEKPIKNIHKIYVQTLVHGEKPWERFLIIF